MNCVFKIVLIYRKLKRIGLCILLPSVILYRRPIFVATQANQNVMPGVNLYGKRENTKNFFSIDYMYSLVTSLDLMTSF